jgi:3-oxoacyl-[acyl-carrier protein] reductase
MIVSNVGINTWYGSMLGAGRSKFSRAAADNAWPLIALVQAGLDHGLRDGGAVVAVSSIGARQVQPWLGAYAAGKAALESVVRNLARELGPRGVRLNAVAPGLVMTEMSRVLWDGGQIDEEASLLPLQRLGTPEDIAGPIVFLLSDEAAWITGATIDVDGGRLLVGQEPRHLYGNYDAPVEFP